LGWDVVEMSEVILWNNTCSGSTSNPNMLQLIIDCRIPGGGRSLMIDAPDDSDACDGCDDDNDTFSSLYCGSDTNDKILLTAAYDVCSTCGGGADIISSVMKFLCSCHIISVALPLK
jgi:hypothetical protein